MATVITHIYTHKAQNPLTANKHQPTHRQNTNGPFYVICSKFNDAYSVAGCIAPNERMADG
jgi:hypothetical protein